MVSTRVQTTRGYARIIFNENWLIVSFFRHDESLIESVAIPLLQPEIVYNGAWNLYTLRSIIKRYEPKVKKK